MRIFFFICDLLTSHWLTLLSLWIKRQSHIHLLRICRRSSWLEERLPVAFVSSYYDLRRWFRLMYRAWMIACQCITASGVKTLLLLSLTNVVNREEWGGWHSREQVVSNLLASWGHREVLSYLLDKFGRDSLMEQLPAHHINKQTNKNLSYGLVIL